MITPIRLCDVLALTCFIFSNKIQNHKLIQSSIEGTKRATSKEMEQNEKLESFKLRLENDFTMLEQKRELIALQF